MEWRRKWHRTFHLLKIEQDYGVIVKRASVARSNMCGNISKRTRRSMSTSLAARISTYPFRTTVEPGLWEQLKQAAEVLYTLSLLWRHFYHLIEDEISGTRAIYTTMTTSQTKNSEHASASLTEGNGKRGRVKGLRYKDVYLGSRCSMYICSIYKDGNLL
jgi:hypothetical protein